MIYNNIFSANNRLPNTICRQQAKQVDIATLIFNHENPMFAFVTQGIKLIQRDLNKQFN
jgi:hypothetical protein